MAILQTPDIRSVFPEKRMPQTQEKVLSLADTIGRMSMLRKPVSEKLAHLRGEYGAKKIEDPQAKYFHGGYAGEIVWALFNGTDSFALRPTASKFYVSSNSAHTLKYAEDWAEPKNDQQQGRLDGVRRRLARKLGISERDIERSGLMDPVILRFKDGIENKVEPSLGDITKQDRVRN